MLLFPITNMVAPHKEGPADTSAIYIDHPCRPSKHAPNATQCPLARLHMMTEILLRACSTEIGQR
jgi:hypothetical protein